MQAVRRESWRRASGAEINGTFSCLFMVAPNSGTLYSAGRETDLRQERGGAGREEGLGCYEMFGHIETLAT